MTESQLRAALQIPTHKTVFVDLKFKSRRTSEIRQAEPTTSEHEIEERVRRDVETGEFERVG